MASKTDGQFRLPVRISDSRKGRKERQSVPSAVVIPKAQPEILAPLEPTESEVVEAQVC